MMKTTKKNRPKNILLTGASGMLGLRLLPRLNAHFKKANIYAVFHAPPGSSSEVFDCSAVGDLSDKPFLNEVLERSQPELIINLAALTDVERCEREPDLAHQINKGIISNMCELVPDARIVQLSTDYVFDGATGNYSMESEPNPCSVYGSTKHGAEQVVLQQQTNLIIRTSGVYDWLNEKNLFGFFLKALAKKQNIKALVDCYYSPIWADDLAQGVVGLISAGVSGIQHYAGCERVDRMQFAQTMAETFAFESKLIAPQTLSEFNWQAKRPLDSSLDSQASYKIAKVAPKPLALAFAEMQLQISSRNEALPS